VVALAVGRVANPVPAALIGWAAFVASFTALSYAARFAGPSPPKDVAYRWDSSIAALVQTALVLGIVLLIAWGRDKRDFFALRRPRSWARAAGISLGILGAVVLLAQLLGPYIDPEAEQGLTPTYWDPDRAPQFAAYAIAVAVAAPIVEELVFRGAGFTLLAQFGERAAIAVTGVAFGLAHGLVEGLPIITAFGLGLAVLRNRTDSLYPCILLHSAFNALALGLSLTT
jgi:membrane protease YdiL (CAAX protease family)